MSRIDYLSQQVEEARAIQRLFLGDGTQLTPDARVFMGLLRRACMLGSTPLLRDEQGRVDPMAHVARDGARGVFDVIETALNRDIRDLEAAMIKATETRE